MFVFVGWRGGGLWKEGVLCTACRAFIGVALESKNRNHIAEEIWYLYVFQEAPGSSKCL